MPLHRLQVQYPNQPLHVGNRARSSWIIARLPSTAWSDNPECGTSARYLASTSFHAIPSAPAPFGTYTDRSSPCRRGRESSPSPPDGAAASSSGGSPTRTNQSAGGSPIGSLRWACRFCQFRALESASFAFATSTPAVARTARTSGISVYRHAALRREHVAAYGIGIAKVSRSS